MEVALRLVEIAQAKMDPSQSVPKHTDLARAGQVFREKVSQEAAWWDAHHSEIEAEIRQRVKQKRPLTLSNLLRGAKPSQPVTLRIPKEDLDTARRLAARKGLGYQTYIKMLLREALAKNAEASAE